MSAAELDEAPPPVQAPPPAPRSARGLKLLLLLAVISGTAAAGYVLMRKPPPATDAAEQAPKVSTAQAEYLALQPAFVVNLADEEAARYLQVDIEVMARSSAALNEVERHLPRIRNSLLLLLGSRSVSDLADRAGKEQLQADVTAEIQRVLTAETGQGQIEAVYFSNFVMQ